VERHARVFAEARPFRHIVWDGFLESELAEAVRASFPSLRAMTVRINRFTEKKTQESNLGKMSDPARRAHTELAAPRFLALLERVTGIPQLSADPELLGGGLHQGGNGSFLKIHADFNVHPSTLLYRRLNILIYLNPDWRDEYGGHLELWDAEMRACVRAISPTFNRCVLIETGDTAYHGYSRLRLPPGLTRKSLAAYYYSPVPREAERLREHSTIFRARPHERRQAFVFRTFSAVEARLWPTYRRLRNLRRRLRGT
jgi:hypothetical protein